MLILIASGPKTRSVDEPVVIHEPALARFAAKVQGERQHVDRGKQRENHDEHVAAYFSAPPSLGKNTRHASTQLAVSGDLLRRGGRHHRHGGAKRSRVAGPPCRRRLCVAGRWHDQRSSGKAVAVANLPPFATLSSSALKCGNICACVFPFEILAGGRCWSGWWSSARWRPWHAAKPGTCWCCRPPSDHLRRNPALPTRSCGR